MRTPLQINFHGMDPSEAVEQRVQEKLEHLEKFSDKILGCRVVVDRPHQHHQHGALYTVRVELDMAKSPPIHAGRNHHADHAHEDVYVALRDTFQAAERQLRDLSGKHRDQQKREGSGI